MVAIGDKSGLALRALRTRMLRGSLLTSTIIVGAVAVALPAHAQKSVSAGPSGEQTTASAGAATADSQGEIVVTGSLIKNPALSGNAPVSVLGQSEVTLRQNNTAEELVKTLPGATAGIGSAVSSNNPGAATVNLRGLGSNRNLVLLDGNRIVPFGLSGATDLNNIPLALIQRTEVLTGGASTTYGADAISGVVNFITRNDFTGAELSGGTSITQKGDGPTYRTDATVGTNFNEKRGNVVLSLGYEQVDPVYRGDRSISNTVIDSFTGLFSGSGTAVPSRFTIAGTTLGTRQIDPTTGALVSTFSTYNFAPPGSLQQGYKRVNVYGAAHYDLTDHITFYTRGMYSKNTVSTFLPPSGLSGITVAIPYSNPYLPAAARTQICTAVGLTAAQCTAAAAATTTSDPNYRTFNAAVFRRATELGAKVSKFRTKEYDLRGGFKGDITSHLHFDVSGSYGHSNNVQDISGYTSNSRFRDAALATNTSTCLSGNTGCVPVNLFGADGSINSAMLNYLQASSTTYVTTSLGQARAVITGDLGYHTPWAAEAINFAVGGEYRRYSAAQGADALANSGDLGGLAATPIISGGYEVKEGFGELIVPIAQDVAFAQNLTLNGGIRYSSYKVFAAGDPSYNTTTWKVGGDWAPIQLLKFRGGFQHAVRAPNIGELFTPVTITTATLTRDACAGAAPTTNANLSAICLAQGAPANSIGNIAAPTGGLANATAGGNPNLRPEISNSYTIGAVLQPRDWVPGLTATVDFYHIKVTKAVSSPSVADVYGACFNSITSASASSAACTSIRRSGVTGLLSGDGVAGVPLAYSNSGKYVTEGIDFGVQYRHPFGAVVLNASIDGNYTMHFRSQASPTSYNHECAGYFGFSCGGVDGSIQPKFTFNQRTTLTYSGVDLSLLWRHLGSLDQEPYDVVNSGAAFPGFGHIKAYNYFDLSVRTVVSKRFELTMTVMNLANKQAPFVGSTIGNSTFNTGNTYPSTYDTLGRRYAVGAKVHF
jgi:iron complex outermembrane receptor protein